VAARTVGAMARYSARMLAQYMGILVLIAVAAILCGAMVTLSWLLGPKKPTPYKESPYECGVEPIGEVHERFPVKFYLVAIVFILFDIEAVFLWSWYTVYKGSDTQFMIFSFVEFIGYMATWILGYLYAIRVGAIDWDETTSLAPEKLGDEANALVGGVS
jgi:NADH-quinone oxidoreductase subunit A